MLCYIMDLCRCFSDEGMKGCKKYRHVIGRASKSLMRKMMIFLVDFLCEGRYSVTFADLMNLQTLGCDCGTSKAIISKWQLPIFFNALSSQSDNGGASSPVCHPGNNKPSPTPMRQPVVLLLSCPCSEYRCNKSPPDFLLKREQPDFVR